MSVWYVKNIVCFLDCEHPRWQEYKSCKNSTLLDTSNAVAVEKVAQLADLSAILSEFYIRFSLSWGKSLIYVGKWK